MVSWRRSKTGAPCHALRNSDLDSAIAHLVSKRRMGRIRIWEVVKDVGNRIDIPTISPQSLRKTYCFKKLKEEYPPKVVASMMGCGMQLVLGVYSQMAPEDVRRWVVEGSDSYKG